MKRISAALFALATFVMVASTTYGQNGCTDATIKGTYGFNLTGSLGTLPLAIVGLASFNGEGSAAATYTISVNGDVATGVHIIGTYAVNPDCTASVTDMTNDAHYTAVILRHGAEMFFINTDTGNTFTGDFKKQIGN
jgi:hypothetical protein